MLSIVVLIVLDVVERIFDNVLTTAVLPFLWTQLKAIVAEPIGPFLFLVVVIHIARLLFQLVDRSPTAEALRKRFLSKNTPEPDPAAKDETPPPLSVDETNLINVGRVFWRTIGNNAFGHAGMLLQNLQEALTPGNRLAMLLHHPVGDMQAKREAVDNALRDHSRVPLTTVTYVLEDAFGSYMLVVRWIHACEELRNYVPLPPHLATLHERWRKLDQEFVTKISELAIHPSYSAMRTGISQMKDKVKFE